MELNGSTFLLEILNFLVLLWLLQRFFYKPLRAVIARRRAGIEQQLADAESLHARARELQSQYENRLGHWEQERQQARERLQQELGRERARQQEALRTTLEQERQKAEVGQRQRQQALEQQLERRALEQGGRFAARLLEQSAGPELEARLLTLLLDSLPQLPDDRRQALREQQGRHPGPVEVASAFPLPDRARKRLQQGLQTLLDRPVDCRYREDPQLLAGLRVSIGPWMLRASLRDELQAFAEVAQANGDGRCDVPPEPGNG